jgi:hypothetical protein
MKASAIGYKKQLTWLRGFFVLIADADLIIKNAGIKPAKSQGTCILIVNIQQLRNQLRSGNSKSIKAFEMDIKSALYLFAKIVVGLSILYTLIWLMVYFFGEC